jgi:hypothetical protein
VEAIDPNVAVGHDSIENNKDTAMRIFFGKRKCLPIPGETGRKESSRRAAWIVLVNRAGDTPVMWHSDALPLGIVKGGLCCTWLIAFDELPMIVEINDRAGRSLRKGHNGSNC